MAISAQKITPCLWFDDKAEEAASYYVAVFGNSRIIQIERYPKATEAVSGKKKGSVMTVAFELEGQEFLALNGGTHFTITPAISFIVYCDSQEEVDAMWAKLCQGGDERAQQCGWLQDKFGVSWQIIPRILLELLKEPERRERVMAALLEMKKIDIAALKAA